MLWDLGNASLHLSGSDGLSLLLEWWSQSDIGEFADIALAMAQDESISLSPWRDGARLLTLILELHGSGYFDPVRRANELINMLDDLVAGLFDDSDDLRAMSDLRRREILLS
ncbi:hypothetical protein [Devosia elaeis]|uniref:Uncharacterized protein n=1 Tax=Devosia elaeis TaxID=1770058 RepID=A0A178HWD1_9HYPH|nr:hypothetical protein [Devosia elaeis]OAM77133.1 hypothetical protein A3840_10900 [Devosia elaeis]